MGPHPSEDVFGFTLFPWCRPIPYGSIDLRRHPKTPLLDAGDHIRDNTSGSLPQRQNPKIKANRPGASEPLYTSGFSWARIHPKMSLGSLYSPGAI
jgi:hypothetical protein